MLLRIAFVVIVFDFLKKLSNHKLIIEQPERNPYDTKRELSYTLLGLLLTSIITTAGMYLFLKKGWLTIYQDKEEFGLLYYYSCFPISLLALDSYFYLTHRIFHLGWFYRNIHYVHHLSIHTKGLTGTSFHPVEFLTFYSFPILLGLLLPLHINILNFIAWSTFILVTFAHSGLDPFPDSFRKSSILSLWNTPTHHHLHHHLGNGNFSLYFNFWDRILKTNCNSKLK
jgi:Delta7-sterol 5-desaturase